MQSPPNITFRNTDPSPVVDALVRTRIERLERFFDRIVGCDVVIDSPQKKKLHARGFSVRVNLHVPGQDISVVREVAQGAAQQDLKLAVNRAFAALEKQLKETKRTKAALEVKHHPPVLHGEVTEIEPDLGWGYLRADDGRTVYFQKDGLEGGNWGDIARGTRLRFHEIEGEKGPYAASVSVIG